MNRSQMKFLYIKLVVVDIDEIHVYDLLTQNKKTKITVRPSFKNFRLQIFMVKKPMMISIFKLTLWCVRGIQIKTCVSVVISGRCVESTSSLTFSRLPVLCNIQVFQQQSFGPGAQWNTKLNIVFSFPLTQGKHFKNFR